MLITRRFTEGTSASVCLRLASCPRRSTGIQKCRQTLKAHKLVAASLLLQGRKKLTRCRGCYGTGFVLIFVLEAPSEHHHAISHWVEPRY